MAIDTLAKRQAVPGCGRPWMRTVEPNASKTEEWRVSVGNAYNGTALGILLHPAGGLVKGGLIQYDLVSEGLVR